MQALLCARPDGVYRLALVLESYHTCTSELWLFLYFSRPVFEVGSIVGRVRESLVVMTYFVFLVILCHPSGMVE